MALDDAVEWRSLEHAAGLYVLGLFHGDSWLMSEGVLAAVQMDGGARARVVEMLTRALEMTKDFMPGDARATIVAEVQHQVGWVAKNLGDHLPRDADPGDSRDPELRYLDEPLRRLCDGD